MTRRVAFIVALFSMAALLPVTAVSADVSSEFGVIEPIARTYPLATIEPSQASPNETIPWGLDRIDQRGPISSSAAQRTYSYQSTGDGVTVYVVDTGVQADHLDFEVDGSPSVTRVEEGWSYRSDLQAVDSYVAARDTYDSGDVVNGIRPCSQTYSLSLDGDTYSSFTKRFSPNSLDGVYDASQVGHIDNDGHGTHVAGTIGGLYSGVAKDVRIVPVQVMNSCGVGTGTMILKGLNWILQQHTPGQKAIVNMSLGFTAQVWQVDKLIYDMLDEGIVVVAAAGNSGTTACNTTPAGTLGTISVGASAAILSAPSTFSDLEPDFSNYGSCVDIFAPGYRVASTWSYLKGTSSGSTAVPNPIVPLDGTSMAAPHVTGAIARYLQGVSLAGVQPSTIAASAMNWLRTGATCNAVSYYRSGVTQTPNRLLAVGAPTATPCSPTSPVATGGSESATVSWTEPVAYNGEAPTYTATAQPGNRQCVTTATTCTITGLAGGVRHTISVTASNSAGTSSAATTTVTPLTVPVLSGLELVPASGSIVVRWSSSTTTDTTFTAVASPGGQQCVTTSTSCTIEGLSNNEQYSITVTGANYAGTSSVAGTSIPNGTPSVPATVRTSTQVGQVTFRWGAITDSVNPTYTLATRDGRYSCTTTSTSCTIRNLPNGKLRTLYLRTSTTSGGLSQAETSVKAWAGFKVRRTELRKSSQTLLTSIVTPVSTGRRSWSTSSRCRISAGRLIAPRRATTCYLTLKVAKSGTAPAMSVRLKLTVG